MGIINPIGVRSLESSKNSSLLSSKEQATINIVYTEDRTRRTSNMSDVKNLNDFFAQNSKKK